MAANIILITGATSGFGKATAELFAEKGYDIIITGRRAERLTSLKTQLENKYGVKVKELCFDVRNEKECLDCLNSLNEGWKAVDILVNNAGLASGLDKINDGDLEDWNKMIDTNIKGLLYVSRAVMPWMVRRKQGLIVNIGSTAGKEVYENAAIYCATKHAVDAITKGMRIDMLKHGIKVSQVAPGAAETEFSEVRFHGDKERAKKIYEGYQPLKAENIASIIWYLATLPPEVCINDLVVTSLSQANSFYINRNN